MVKPLIVGIDPGTTTGLAILNLNGDILHLYSKKEFKGIERVILKIGEPLILSSDKRITPKYVKKMNSKFNSIIFNPDKDIKKIEKKRLLKEVDLKVKDDHQRDALTSAIFAFKHYQQRFKKIDVTLSSLNLESHSNEVKKMIVKREVMNISEAIDVIMNKKVKKTVHKKSNTKDTKKLENTIVLQNILIGELKNKIKTLNLEFKKRSRDELKRREIIRKKIIKNKEMTIRENLIIQMQNLIKKKDEKIKELKKQLNNSKKPKPEEKIEIIKKGKFMNWLKILLYIQRLP